MSSFFDNLFKIIGNLYIDFKNVNNLIGDIIVFLCAYKTLYIILGIFFTRKFKPAKTKHKYGIVIAARNEEKVIGNLLDSINKQDYPKELLKVFVVADNCDDNTANIAKKYGAICYSRNDSDHRTKGYALQFLFDRIREDYGIESFDGYFVFDADNLLKKDYVSRMNDAFDSGEKIITSYRNTKNFNENWIAASYGLHWLRSIRTNHRARSILRLATNIQGTGFLFSNEIVLNGWKYTSLTEDRALTADAVAQGYSITYQDAAEFYDEQPVNLKVVLRQRLRWSKGHLQAFAESGPYLFLNIFWGKRFLKTKWKGSEDNFSGGFLDIVRKKFASFDTLIQLTPFSFINLCRWLLVVVLMYGCYSYSNGINGINLFGGSIWLAKLFRSYFNIKISLEPGIRALFYAMLIQLWLRILYRIGNYFVSMWTALYVFIIERKRIIKISIWKKIWYIFTWPIFDIIGRYTTYIAIFKKVEWKPIPHESKITIDDLNK